ncbi:MAG TPA: hypothetical protein VMM76_09800 [Pirellulaceae bacterium]|nr:hypothetical protein [Pirellulaceae bacterium]
MTAIRLGQDQNDITLNLTKSNQGAPGAPTITVNGKSISARLNTNPFNQTTALDLVNAINSNLNSSALVIAEIVSGNPDRILATTNAAEPPIPTVTLSGANDIVIKPGFLGPGAAPKENEIIVRFADTLPDDLYRIDVFGTHPLLALRNTDRGCTYNGDSSLVNSGARRVAFSSTTTPSQMALALAAAVTNTPGIGITASAAGGRVTLTGNSTATLSNGIVGASRGLDTFVTSAENPNFYKLFFTRETVENTDDTAFVPTSVQYDPATDSAVLTFAAPLEELERTSRFTANATTNVITSLSHRLVDGDLVRVDSTTTLPGGLQPGVNYFVVNRTPDTFQLATHPDNVPLDITSTGIGEHEFRTEVGPGVMRLRIGTDEARPAAPVAVGLNVEAMSNFNNNVTVRFQSDELTAEQFGSAIRVTLTKSDHRGPSVPRVTVRGNQVTVDLNTNLGNESTAQDLVNAINADGRSRALMFASIDSGNAAEPIADTVANHFSIKLVGLGSSFDTATNLSNVLDTQGIVLSSRIETQVYPLEFPGSSKEPGHREISDSGLGDEHIAGNAKDTTAGITTFKYIFRNVYGSIPDNQGGQQLAFNLITSAQRQRAREVFELISQAAGVQFIETVDELDTTAIIVATGDVRAIPFTVSPQSIGGVGVRVGLTDVADGPGVDSRRTLILDNTVSWNDQYGLSDEANRSSWFRSAFDGVMRLFGIGNTLDLPALTVTSTDTEQLFDNTLEPIFPGDHDIVHLQRLFRPESKDIDLYKFTINVPAGEAGIFTAETFAERLPNASQLDTTLNLYREIVDANGVVTGHELIARNGDYYSNDSYIEVKLAAGTYYIGVSASGNDDYDPIIEDTGFGGTSEGTYDLRLNFRGDAEFSIIDADNFDLTGPRLSGAENTRLTTRTPLDGNADGIPGGVYNFWFETQRENRVVDVTAGTAGFVDGQVITLTDGQGTVRRFEIDRTGAVAAGNRRIDVNGLTASGIAQRLANVINAEPGFLVQVVDPRTGSTTLSGAKFELVGERSITLTSGFAGIELGGRTIFVDKTAPSNPDGSLSNPFNNLASTAAVNAVGASQRGDIIQVVGNDADGNNSTLTDRVAYEVGFNNLGQPLRDGTTLEIPRGVTMMIDEGAVFKLRRARIGVGSSAPGIDRSGGALQVLGTPENNVFFTSYHDESIGTDTFSFATTPLPGDWGGLLFRDDNDRGDGNFVYDEEGIFLNYVNNADIRYGGGNVVINSVAQVVNPIHIIDTRPTIAFNSISRSADAAISASPNSFEETNFHAPRHQKFAFTSDYDRVGPDIYKNAVFGNSVNGLFIRIQTPAGNSIRPMTVSGRFDDADIVHVFGENLLIQGTPGGLLLEPQPPTIGLITQTPVAGGTLLAGTYNYRLTFVQVLGQPKSPVVLTSLNDDTIGAGFDPRGDVQVQTRDVGDSLQLFQPDSGIAATLAGRLGVSTDGVGTNGSGILQATIPAGASIELALLHVATRNGTTTTFPAPPAFRPQSIRFNGQLLSISYLSNVDDSNNVNFETGRIDVTNIVAQAVLTGVAPNFTFTVDETSTGLPNNVEGTSLTVVYSDPTLPQRTVMILDGGLTGGNPLTNTLTFAQPANPNDPNFIAQLAVGMSFSDPNFPGTGRIDVNGTRLTSSAGGADDSSLQTPTPGNLITVGGVGDSPANPVLPTSNLSPDDELYDLSPFIPVGATQVRLDLANTGANSSMFLAVLTVSGNVSLGNAGRPGEWQGIVLEQYSHDRNVLVVTELEPREVISPGTNATTHSAQFLGQLAPFEKGGDENRRLGFEIHGFLNDRRDYDIYSFTANAGTEVWFDVDRTTYALDSLLELIDADGVVIARSDNSYNESLNVNNVLAPEHRTSSNLSAAELTDPTLLGGLARLMQKQPPFLGEEFYSTNPRDPGMRVILPGALGSINTYHVRIRSSSDNLSDLDGGLTSGAYQLQIRLRELDEVPGSTVRHSNISFAETGIEVLGQPIHSPLIGEAGEVNESNGGNDSTATAQVVGNLVAIDRAALSIAGDLGNRDDVDFFQFDINFQNVRISPSTLEVIFDIDYADGLARANTTMSVFDIDGRLILTSREGNIADDRPGKPGTSQIDDLSRGTVGGSDPFIGAVEMPPGTYFLAISSDATMPAQLEQFFLRNPVNPNLLLEPVNSVRRIVEDHITGNGIPNFVGTADNPQIPLLLDNSSRVQFHLGDVSLFVSTHNLTFDDSFELTQVDPFTGAQETFIGRDVEFEIRDFFIHPNGLIYAYSVGLNEPVVGSPMDANSGLFLEINPATGQTRVIRDDGIETYLCGKHWLPGLRGG